MTMTGRLEIPENENEMRVFHNRLRILTSIDKHELVDDDVIGKNDEKAWRSFTSNPYKWFIRASGSQCRKLWGIIQEREA